MKLHPELKKILSPAYKPCSEFTGACKDMRWDPQKGHVPRGFAGACGELSEVELVLVFAEPGDPNLLEHHKDLQSAYEYATCCLFLGRGQFHLNVRKILDLCWRKLPLEEQLRKVWLTDSVLCSAKRAGASVPKEVSDACGNRYLLDQLSLFPNALIVAVGKKAEERILAVNLSPKKKFRWGLLPLPPVIERKYNNLGSKSPST